MNIAWAFLAAVMFGAGHYLSGTVSRRVGPAAVTLWTQYGVVAVAAVMLVVQPLPQNWNVPALTWGTVAAAGGVVGSLCLYAALSRATFAVAVGASTATATVTPALVAMLFLGEQATILRLILVVLAVLTVWLLVAQKRRGEVSVLTSPLPVVTASMPVVDPDTAHRHADAPSQDDAGPSIPATPRRGSSLLALAAGLGYATELVGVAHIPQEDFGQGLLAWAVASMVLMFLVVGIRRGPRLLPHGLDGTLVLIAGGLSACGMLFFHFSVVGVGLATTSAIVAVYPAVPILLAVMLVGERPSVRGWCGLGCAAAVVSIGALAA